MMPVLSSLPTMALPPTKPPTPAALLLEVTDPVVKLLLMVPPLFKPTKPPTLLALAEEVVEPPTKPTLEMRALDAVWANKPTEVSPEELMFRLLMV